MLQAFRGAAPGRTRMPARIIPAASIVPKPCAHRWHHTSEAFAVAGADKRTDRRHPIFRPEQNSLHGQGLNLRIECIDPGRPDHPGGVATDHTEHGKVKDNRNEQYGWRERWNQYQPSKKGTFGLMVASVLVVSWAGFGTGAWTTSAKAQEMASTEVREARNQIAGAWCVDRFMASQDASAHLTELQELRSRFQRTQYIERGDWSVLPGETRPSRAAAQRCADLLMEMELQIEAEPTNPTEEL